MDRKGVGRMLHSSKRTKGGVFAKAIQVDDLRPFFGHSAEDAAKELGVGLTVLKRRCRELGVSRWPYRQIKCVEKLIEYTELGECGNKRELNEKLEQLREHKESILSGRPTQLPPWAKRSQQHLSKMNYRAKFSKNFHEDYGDDRAVDGANSGVDIARDSKKPKTDAQSFNCSTPKRPGNQDDVLGVRKAAEAKLGCWMPLDFACPRIPGKRRHKIGQDMNSEQEVLNFLRSLAMQKKRTAELERRRFAKNEETV